ncbi:hypothetical protein Tco_0362082, partial [Tanacetum coccineum]
ESSTVRPIEGRGVDYGFVSTIDAEARWQGISEVGYGLVCPLLEDAQDRDSMDGGGGGLCFPRGLGSLDRVELGDSSGASVRIMKKTRSPP